MTHHYKTIANYSFGDFIQGIASSRRAQRPEIEQKEVKNVYWQYNYISGLIAQADSTHPCYCEGPDASGDEAIPLFLTMRQKFCH